jgi:hypothetical protein
MGLHWSPSSSSMEEEEKELEGARETVGRWLDQP